MGSSSWRRRSRSRHTTSAGRMRSPSAPARTSSRSSRAAPARSASTAPTGSPSRSEARPRTAVSGSPRARSRGSRSASAQGCRSPSKPERPRGAGSGELDPLLAHVRVLDVPVALDRIAARAYLEAAQAVLDHAEEHVGVGPVGEQLDLTATELVAVVKAADALGGVGDAALEREHGLAFLGRPELVVRQ